MKTLSFEQLPSAVDEIRSMLEGIDQKLSRKDELTTRDQWFSIEDLQEYHPDKPARATIYGWIHKKSIPFHKGGKKLRFKKSEIDSWINDGGKKMEGGKK